MRYTSTLLAVTDLEKSKRFYCGVLGMSVTADFGTNIVLSDVLSLQTLESWQSLIGRNDVAFSTACGELYFEEENMDLFLNKLDEVSDIRYVHRVKEHPWGQRAVRFYDPDMHIVEVGEPIDVVVKRFMANGLTTEETAHRMDVSSDFIRQSISKVRKGG